MRDPFLQPGPTSFSIFAFPRSAEPALDSPSFYRNNKPCLLNLLSPTEANLIFREKK